MVPERDRIDAQAEDLLGEAWSDPDSVRGVLAVDDAGVDPVLVSNGPKSLRECAPTGRADHVGDEEDAQGGAA